jgi:SAM-dependent methyltransferase
LSGVTPDGSPVEVYLRLPGNAEAELIASVVPKGAEILELGSGAGRVTHELVARGFRVTAVDESAEMLEHIHGAPTVCARIETLDLAQTFDCVLLASHFVNVAADEERRLLLSAACRHVDDAGLVLVEAYPPDLEWAVGSPRRIGDVELRLADVAMTGRLVRATMEYRVGDATWLQDFDAVLLDEHELEAVLKETGLRFDRWLDRERGWLVARKHPRPVA